MKSKVILICFVGFIFSCGTKKDAKKYIREGNLKFIIGDYKEAILAYNIALEIDSANALAYNNRSAARRAFHNHYDSGYNDFLKAIEIDSSFIYSHYKTKNSRAVFKAALDEYDLAINKYPYNKLAYLGRANVRIKFGDTSGADDDTKKFYNIEIQEYDEKIISNPNDANAIYKRAIAKVNFGHLIGALEDINNAIKLEVDTIRKSRLYEVRSSIKKQLGNIEDSKKDEIFSHLEMIKVYTSYINNNPENSKAYEARGEYFLKIKEYKKALVDLNNSLVLNPNSIDALYIRLVVKYNLNDLNGALEDLNFGLNKLIKGNLKKVWENKFLLKKIDVMYQLMDYHGTIKECNRLIKDSLGIDKVYLLRAYAKTELGENFAAIQDFNYLLKRIFKPEEESKIYATRAYNKGEINDLKGAMLDFEKSINLDPKNAKAYKLRGDLKYEQGDNYGACNDWSKAGELGYTKVYSKIKAYCK